VLGLAAGVLPSLAVGDPPPAAQFTAYDYGWMADGGAGTSATIAQGGTVTFSYPTGGSDHNADFGTGPQPSSCNQTAGTSTGSVPPLPHQPGPPGWSGTCTFNTPGTFSFYCDFHPYMTGTIVVQAAGSTTTTTTGTTTPSTTITSTTTTSTTPKEQPPPTEPGVPIGPPLQGSASSAISVPATQRGFAIRGSVRISRAGAGGRLEVDMLAGAHSLGSSRHGLVDVGHLVRLGLPEGKVRFSVPLGPRARRALQRRHRVMVTVKIAVTSPRGAKASTSHAVVLRP
jgi:hypothetical protein